LVDLTIGKRIALKFLFGTRVLNRYVRSRTGTRGALL